MVIVLNILGVVVGVAIVEILFPLAFRLFAAIVNVPILGWFVTGAGWIDAFSYVLQSLMVFGLSLVAAVAICKPNKKGRKIGLFFLAAYYLFSALYLPYSWITSFGFKFAFLTCAVFLLYLTYITVQYALGKEDV